LVDPATNGGGGFVYQHQKLATPPCLTKVLPSQASITTINNINTTTTHWQTTIVADSLQQISVFLF
jgi:hypothetical protein